MYSSFFNLAIFSCMVSTLAQTSSTCSFSLQLALGSSSTFSSLTLPCGSSLYSVESSWEHFSSSLVQLLLEDSWGVEVIGAAPDMSKLLSLSDSWGLGGRHLGSSGCSCRCSLMLWAYFWMSSRIPRSCSAGTLELLGVGDDDDDDSSVLVFFSAHTWVPASFLEAAFLQQHPVGGSSVLVVFSAGGVDTWVAASFLGAAFLPQQQPLASRRRFTSSVQLIMSLAFFLLSTSLLMSFRVSEASLQSGGFFHPPQRPHDDDEVNCESRSSLTRLRLEEQGLEVAVSGPLHTPESWVEVPERGRGCVLELVPKHLSQGRLVGRGRLDYYV